MPEWLDFTLTAALIYLAVNAVVFFLYGIDKWKAQNERWRISEAALLWAAVFGVFGAIAGMYTFRHKTQKPKFCITVPLILVLEAAGVIAAVMLKR